MYFPMMRWKNGEKKAIQNAPDNWLQKITPVWMFENPVDYLTEHYDIKEVWKGSLIMDASRDDPSIYDSELTRIQSDFASSVAIAPKSLQDMSKKFVDTFSQKPCFRIQIDDYQTAITLAFHASQIDLIKKSGLTNITLILDFCEISTEHIENSMQIATIVSAYHQLEGVSSIIISSGIFPKMLAGIIGRRNIERIDKKFYLIMKEEVAMPLLYSDYATINPWWRQDGIMRSSHSNVRYTHDDYWVVIRESGRDGNTSHILAQLLISYPEFRGENFSWADDIWHKRGQVTPEVGPGNSTNHVSEFIHHHIAQVLKSG